MAVKPTPAWTGLRGICWLECHRLCTLGFPFLMENFAKYLYKSKLANLPVPTLPAKNHYFQIMAEGL